SDLDADTFLHGEAPGENANQARELRDPDDLLVRDVADVGMTVEREHVVFAQRVELDRSLDDLADAAVGPAVAFGRESSQEFGVALIPGRRFEKRVQVAAGSGASPRCVEVHAERLKDLRGVGLEFLPLGGAYLARADLLPMCGFFWIER